VRTPAKLPVEAGPLVSIHPGDLNALAPADLAGLVSEPDAVINCAGHVTDGGGKTGSAISRGVTGCAVLRHRTAPFSANEDDVLLRWDHSATRRAA